MVNMIIVAATNPMQDIFFLFNRPVYRVREFRRHEILRKLLPIVHAGLYMGQDILYRMREILRFLQDDIGVSLNNGSYRSHGTGGMRLYH